MPRAHDEPLRLSDGLYDVMRGLRPAGDPGGSGLSPAVLGGVFGKWEEAVGAAVAAHVQPVKLDGTTLVVSADDPAWATQLRFLEATLRERLLEVAGAVVERIEVRVVKGSR